MLLALDFDATYTLDPVYWNKVIELTRDSGHEIIMATYRHEIADWDPIMEKIDLEIYFTDGKAKKPYLEERGIKVDVWLDDRPLTVVEDSAWGQDSPELAAWREANALVNGVDIDDDLDRG